MKRYYDWSQRLWIDETPAGPRVSALQGPPPAGEAPPARAERRLTGFFIGDPTGPRAGSSMGDLDAMMNPITESKKQ